MERSMRLLRTQWTLKLHPSEGIGEAVCINAKKVKNRKTSLSAYCMEGERKDFNAHNMSAALKFATTALNFPSLKRIPIDRVYTHSSRLGGANSLSLAGYIDRYIQKMGR